MSLEPILELFSPIRGVQCLADCNGVLHRDSKVRIKHLGQKATG